MHSNEALLMTATINVKNTPDVTIKNQEERLLEYLCSLIAWIKLTHINKIVFCENSNTSYDFTEIIEFAKNKGKTLEVLVFDGNQESQQYGKGFGEGKIIKHAINNSKYLNEKVNFYKITGRLFVPEFDKVQHLHSDIPNVFKIPAFSPEEDPWTGISQGDNKTVIGRFRSTLRFVYVFLTRGRGRGPHNYNNHVSTVFYKSNVNFYKRHLINSYKRVNDRKSYAIEHIFYEDLIKKDFSPFLMDYHIVGRRGSTGKLIDGQDYTDDIKNLAKTFV